MRSVVSPTLFSGNTPDTEILCTHPTGTHPMKRWWIITWGGGPTYCLEPAVAMVLCIEPNTESGWLFYPRCQKHSPNGAGS